MLKNVLKLSMFTFFLSFLLNSCSDNDDDASDKSDIKGNKYVTQLFEYCPAPGQFINTSLGNQASARSILSNKNKGLVSLGAWGGYVVYGFDHTVINQEGANDIVVYGNAMPKFSEAGIVWVMEDTNQNGLPDDIWYELGGSEFLNKETYKREYAVTYYRPKSSSDNIAWKDNEGNEGFILKNQFHSQEYYPEWIKEDSYTLSGSWLKGMIDKEDPENVKSMPFEWGYADNIVGGDSLDIDNAIDKDGKKVHLSGIKFIKIQTGVLADMGKLGELSTEISAIEDLSM